MTKIYLTGQSNFGSRGCEALVRSTVAAFKKASGEVEVLVPSDDIDRDFRGFRQWPEAAQSAVHFVQGYMPAHTILDAHSTTPITLFETCGVEPGSRRQ